MLVEISTNFVEISTELGLQIGSESLILLRRLFLFNMNSVDHVGCECEL